MQATTGLIQYILEVVKIGWRLHNYQKIFNLLRWWLSSIGLRHKEGVYQRDLSFKVGNWPASYSDTRKVYTNVFYFRFSEAWKTPVLDFEPWSVTWKPRRAKSLIEPDLNNFKEVQIGPRTVEVLDIAEEYPERKIILTPHNLGTKAASPQIPDTLKNAKNGVQTW